MTPYAYSIADYDIHRVFPTVEALVRALISEGANPVYYRKHCTVEEHYPDGTSRAATLAPWVNEVPVDEAEVARYIDDLREQSKLTGATERCDGYMITGVAPLYMLDRENLIKREIESRRWQWRTP